MTNTNTAFKTNTQPTCSKCEACCCRLEVFILTETGVPERHIEEDQWGGRTMARLDDGWCSALNRNTMACTIYNVRPDICRELEMGGGECKTIRADYHKMTLSDC
ncbi:MAG: YkgJ family cysteine cluster protein [Pseudomonadales bacterium]|nr:YkgJ family cysteine cluster protein [Pseudomonadales bacterium]